MATSAKALACAARHSMGKHKPPEEVVTGGQAKWTSKENHKQTCTEQLHTSIVTSSTCFLLEVQTQAKTLKLELSGISIRKSSRYRSIPKARFTSKHVTLEITPHTFGRYGANYEMGQRRGAEHAQQSHNRGVEC